MDSARSEILPTPHDYDNSKRAAPLVSAQAKLVGPIPEPVAVQSKHDAVDWAIAIHGGAGNITNVSTIGDRLEAFKAILEEGKKMLAAGKTAVDTAEAVVALLEDCPWFNAGKGSVFTHIGTQEMDASIMDGSTLESGACALVSLVKNPIKLARVVMKKTTHILVVGHAAEELGFNHGIERADQHYFFVQERYDQLVLARQNNIVQLDHGGSLPAHETSYVKSSSSHVGKEVPAKPFYDFNKNRMNTDGKQTLYSPSQRGQMLTTSPMIRTSQTSPALSKPPATSPTLKLEQMPLHAHQQQQHAPIQNVDTFASEDKYSTVGCVVLDKYGNLASAASTGGLTNKQPGRMGDTPIIGAGVYAANDSCAVACTGHGETFIKNSVACTVANRMRFLNRSSPDALADVIIDILPPLSGGAISVDRNGTLSACYNTSGMFTGFADSAGLFEAWDRYHGPHRNSDDFSLDGEVGGGGGGATSSAASPQ